MHDAEYAPLSRYDYSRDAGGDRLFPLSAGSDARPRGRLPSRPLHPPTPRREGELLIRRDLIERGIYLLLARGLIERVFTDDGIGYQASDLAGSVVASLTTTYSALLRERARWVSEAFGTRPGEILDRFFKENLDRWDGEFAYSYAALEEDQS